MWDSEKSAKLTLYLTDLFLSAACAAVFLLPWAVGRYIAITGKPAQLKTVLVVVCYCCLPAALCALLALRRLLKNMMRGKIFSADNVTLLRILSWCCAAAAIITLVSGWFYLPFYIIGTAAAFFMLILRVIKNVFCSAIEIKADNELTI